MPERSPFAGAVTLESGSVLDADLGTTSDKLALSGGFTGPAAGPVTINVNAVGGFGAGVYPLVTGATGISASDFAVGVAPQGYACALGASGGTLTVRAWTALGTWRHSHVGVPGNTGNAADGALNAQEFDAGTDPLSAASVLRIILLPATGNDRPMSFPSVAGKTCLVERSDTLAVNSWTTVQDNIAGTGATVPITDPGGSTQPKRFYRIVLLP